MTPRKHLERRGMMGAARVYIPSFGVIVVGQLRSLRTIYVLTYCILFSL